MKAISIPYNRVPPRFQQLHVILPHIICRSNTLISFGFHCHFWKIIRISTLPEWIRSCRQKKCQSSKYYDSFIHYYSQDRPYHLLSGLQFDRLRHPSPGHFQPVHEVHTQKLLDSSISLREANLRGLWHK